MKSSRSRSRSKNSRSRSPNTGGGGNVVNRVFDSSGPEGKVRGTPQQIIEKYNQLARDAQVSGDRVATENFQQHAEHYLRMLSEAQREIDARREEQERQNRDRQAEQDRQNRDRQAEQDRQNRDRQSEQDRQNRDRQSEQDRQNRERQAERDRERANRPDHQEAQPQAASDTAHSGQTDVVEADGESGLVETPESQPKPKPRTRTRKPKVVPTDASADDTPQAGNGSPSEAAE
jgi:hypothetical protein